jgi:hypothetical protein
MKPLFPLCILLLSAGCSFPNPDQMKKAFDSTNNSAMRAGYELSRHEYEANYHLIQIRRDTNTLVASKADSLYAVTENAVQYMEQLKHRLYFRKASTEWTVALLSIFQMSCLHAAATTFSSMAHVRKNG